ncbi:CsbD family protein [Streptomyces chrestomyceticus JCM 4735]|uniref:CsbD family protein n=2 Tax=Streptomyces TaxID=1883 RepID=A0A7U9Q2K1_9ACTN|nr:CsbD family protein [Streptomyces chrestomyceticus JCM 4735]
MNMGQAIRNTAQTAKGRIKETLGRTTHNGQTQREGRTDRSMGHLKQAAAKARKAFKR